MTDAKTVHVQPGWGRILAGFLAGFLATLTFHQLTLFLLRAIHLAPMAPFSMQPTVPFGVPVVISLAFWGGIWGILYALIHARFPKGGGYWLSAFVFGAVLPTLVAMLVVLPLKGIPMAGNGNPALLATAVLINGAWGLGTACFLRFVFHR